MNINHGNEMEASSLTCSSAADGKPAVQYNLDRVVQGLTRLAMVLEVLIQQLGLGNLLDPTADNSENGPLKVHDCTDYLVEDSYTAQDQDSTHEVPVVTCLICNTDFTEEIYGHQTIEPDEVEYEGV